MTRNEQRKLYIDQLDRAVGMLKGRADFNWLFYVVMSDYPSIPTINWLIEGIKESSNEYKQLFVCLTNARTSLELEEMGC